MAILHQKREAIFTKEPTCSSSCGRKQSDVFGAILLHWSCRHFIFFFPPFIWYKESYRTTLGKTHTKKKRKKKGKGISWGISLGLWVYFSSFQMQLRSSSMYSHTRCVYATINQKASTPPDQNSSVKKKLCSAPSSWRGTDSASSHYYFRSRTGQIIDCRPKWRKKIEQEWGEHRKRLLSGLGNKQIIQFIAEKKCKPWLQVKLKTSDFQDFNLIVETNKQQSKTQTNQPTKKPKQFNMKIWIQHRVLHYFLTKTFFQLKKLWNFS